MKYLSLLLFVLCFLSSNGQSYISYHTGNPKDTVTMPGGGVCLMGGSRESDDAMRWFLRRAGGGDVLVLRASGSDGYNDYLYSGLGVPVNSVESIVFENGEPAYDPVIHRKIEQAEAIWLAGGNQWNYVNYWRNTPIDSLINEGIAKRNIVIGGTSAGMAVLGGFYFSARQGTVHDSTALTDPYDERVTVDSAHFLDAPYLKDVITDTHFAERNRQGRLIVFLARIFTDYQVEAKAIACDERTAVCINAEGQATVYGSGAASNGHAYFVQPNSDLNKRRPERCRPGLPLEWNRSGKALRVYRVKGDPSGTGSFDLRDWRKGSGGDWLYWYVEKGKWEEVPD